ncbi:oligosaccharide flippase family protein [Pediococcus acidilactici]|uniref:lipopolysaccharide biosynthesis protein n=1 Tax=Pediococcus acidilactici TaxID=1254 RepID=UPI0010588D2E|nr:oligosaccharide flippase family protein [Pediococcus acidilactici]KAF0514940.1 oligosaccharide flippase family protein [Pediococcus acidilactici]MCT3036813.1 lipopolysaccharide biosynthesis protein [Pediococcus acidilactici]QQC45227.1 oligosaccharide flippase family protein [Pediococcus acidilactici]
MNRTKKLFSNSIIFVIGNMGSKLISFLMVPLYTFYLSTGQFGTVDLILTTVNLCLPLVSFSLYDAVFRFIMDKNSNRSKVLATAFFSTVILSIISGCVINFIGFLQKDYLLIFSLILTVTAIFTMFQNFVKAMGDSKTFAFSGILNTLIFACLNVIFLIFLKLGVLGYLISYFLGVSMATLYLLIRERLWNFLSFKNFSIVELKEMLRYSLPLIPNSLAWWFTNDASKFFILMFVGISGNGLFAVANKLPSIVNMFFNVFTQAWQISAVDEFKSNDKAEYFTKVLKYLVGIQVILIAAFLVILRPFVRILFSEQYFDAWKYVPLMLLSVLFANASAFLGTMYLAAKRTAGVFTTTVVGMIVNVLTSWLLTAKLGIFGTCTGVLLGFIIVFGIRIIDVKKFVNVKVEWLNFILSIGLILSMNVVLFISNVWIRYAIVGMLFLAILILQSFIFKDIKNLMHKYILK